MSIGKEAIFGNGPKLIRIFLIELLFDDSPSLLGLNVAKSLPFASTERGHSESPHDDHVAYLLEVHTK